MVKYLNMMLLAVVFTTSTAVAQPNIVVIEADDLGANLFQQALNYSDAAFPNGLLPNIRSGLTEKGTTFWNSFVTTSICCPSRATFLTGQYSHNTGVHHNAGPNGGVTAFDDSSTLPVWLQVAGYRTGQVGKYLNHYGSDPSQPITSPLNPQYIPPGWDDWQATVDFNTYRVYNYKINDNGTVVPYGNASQDYQTDILASRAVSFVEESEANDGEPFFLWVTPLAPHFEGIESVTVPGCTRRWGKTIRPAPRHQSTLPPGFRLLIGGSFNESDVSDKPQWIQNLPQLTSTDVDCVRREYRSKANALRAVDDLVGSMIASLVKNGEDYNTVLIFTSDNGYYHGEHRLTSKGYPHEESVRVPLIIRAPGYPAQMSERFVVNNDLAATIVEVASATAGLVPDGRSLVALLENPATTSWRKRFGIEILAPEIEPFRAVRTSDTDLVPNRLFVNWTNDNELEHYDLITDQYQMASTHSSMPTSEKNTLQEYINNLQTCGGGTCQVFED